MDNLENTQMGFSPSTGGDPVLKEADRQKLAGIVQKMVSNGESEANIKTMVQTFKSKYGVKSKGVSTGENTASQSASVNGGFLSGSSEVRPQSKSGNGLTEKPKTILRKMQDDAMSRPKVGEEIKTKTKTDVKVEQAVKRDEQNWSSNKPIEQKVKASLKPVANQPVKKEKVITQSEFDKNRYSNFDYKYDNPDFENVAPEELSKTEQHFTNFTETGIDPSDFSRYLKNKTEFFDREPNYRDNDSEKLRKSFESDSYLKGYVQDRASFLENKMKYAKTDEEKKNIIVEYNKLGQGYAQYKQKYFPDLVKKEEDLKKRNTEIYDKAKSGEGNALYQTGKVITSFAEGAYKPIGDILQAGIENLDEGFKKIGFDNVLGEGVERVRFAKSYRDMVNDDGFNNVYGKGKEVKYGKDTFIVTENGSVVDKQTGSSVNNIFDSGTIKKITDLSNSTTKESSYFSGVSLSRQVASTAGQMITQIAATRGMGGGAAMTAGNFAKTGAIVNATLLSTSAYNETVSELLKAGVSESDARAAAAELSVYMAGVGALTGALSPNSESAAVVGQKFKNDIVKKAVTAYLDEGVSGIKGFIKNTTKELPNALKETGLENVQELFETKAQNSLNEDINDRFDIKALQEDMTMEDVTNIMIVTSFSTGATSGAGVVSKGASGMFGMDMKTQFDAVSEMNDDDFVKSLKTVVNKGAISPERASEMVNEVRNYRNYKNKLAEGVTGRKAVDATQLMAERDDLKRQKKNLDEAFHPELDAKIEEVNNKISKVLNGKDEEATTSTETGLEENATRPEGEGDQGKTEVSQTVGTGKSTQEFFGNVVKGGDERYEPSKKYEYEQDFAEEQDKFREGYDSKKGNFDEHIATSIPTFRDNQVKKGASIVKILEGAGNPVVYDLGGSEGSWVKTITEQSGGKIKTVNLDPSPDMKEAFDKNKPDNSEMSLEAFHSGWDDVPTHQPKEKADVVHESMMFQFIENGGERKAYIDEVADKYLKEDGIFITEEKFKMNDDAEYAANEKIKERHKNKYYTPEQQSLKSDEVLVGMKENQANFDQYVKDLKEKFKYVDAYWKAGNFRGIIATNNEAKFNQFRENMGDNSNSYTWKPSYTKEEVVETNDAKLFAESQKNANSKRTKDSLQVEILSEEDAQQILDEGGKLFMTNDGKAGAYVKADGYMGGLFKDPTSDKAEAAKILQEVRIEAGGKFFDAFGTHLEDIYIKNGFRPVVRMDFNEEFAPKDWEKTNLKDRPDNVFFVYDPNYKAEKGEGIRNNDYGQAYNIAKKYESNQTKEQSSEETGGNKEGKNTSNSENVRTYVDSPARFKNQKGEVVEGVIKQDGQRVVVETDNEIYDIGNIDEVGDKSLKEMNLTVNDPVTLSEDGKVQVRGKNYTNNFSDPKQAINRDSDGKIISVSLETEDGQKRTFRGQMAEDIAYQIHATEFTKSVDEEVDIDKPDVFDKFIKGVDDLIDAIDRHTKGTLGIGIAPAVAKGALKAVRATAVTTRNTVKAINAGIEYMKSTDWYKGLTQEQKKEFESKTNGEIFEELLKSAKKPEQSMAEKRVETVTIDDKKSTKSVVRENTGQTDKSKKITMTEAKALKDKFKNLQRGFKQGVKDTQQLKRDFVNDVKAAIKGLGNHITETDAKTILNQVANVNEKNIDKVSAVIDNLVARLENRAQKAKIAKLSKLQKRAGVKARTKYGNAGGNINNLIKIPANQIPDAKFDEYYETIEKLSKGEPVDFDKVNQLYEDLNGDIQNYVDRKNQDKTNPKPKDQDKLDKANDEAKTNLKNAVNGNMRGKNNLTDFEKATMKKFMNIPLVYLQSLPTAKMNEITKALQHYQQTGYMSNKVLVDVVMKYNSEKTTAEIMGKVGDTLLKPARGIIGMIDGLRSKDFGANDFFKKISSNMLHHIDNTIKGVKGTLFYDNIVHPITSNFNKSDSETNKIGHEVAELLGKAAKSSGSGFRTNVKIQMFVRQREFESNPELRGTKVYSLDEHMEAMKEHENNTDYVKDDLDVIYEEYDNVKGKSAQEMYDGLTKEEKALVDFMDKELEQQEIASRDYNNHLLGETLTYPKNYFPKKNSFVNGNPDDNAEIKARLFGMTGATSVKADASNERVATGAHPLNFNSTATFMGNVRQSHIEKNLAFPVKQTLMTITNLKKSDNKSLVKVANALEKTVKQLLEVQLGKNPYSYDSKSEQIFNKFTRNTFTRMLIDPIRLSYDVASNYGTVYAAFADKLPQIRKATKNINNEVNEMIHKNISSTQSERMGGSRSSDYKNAMSSPVTKTSNMKANPSFGEQLVDLYENNKVSDFSEAMGDLYYKYADLPAQHLWKYYMSDNFKKITGKEFDGKKYLNYKSYREEVQEDLQKAATSADKQTSNYFNTGSSSEQKLKVQGGKGNLLTRMNNFLRSFTFNENRVFWDSFNGLTGLGNTTFDSKREAFRAFAVVNARGITYSYLGQMVGSYVLNLVTGAEDDEEDEEIINKKALKRSLGQQGMLIAAGNKGMIANFVGNFVVEMINEEVVKADKGKYNPYEDNIFYVPNGKSKYTDFLNNLGAEGMAVKSIVDLGGAGYKLVDTFRNEGEITTEDIVRFKTAQYTVSFVSQLTGLPIDRLGRLTQKALQKKYPYTSKSSGGSSGASFGSFGSSGGSGFGSFK